MIRFILVLTAVWTAPAVLPDFLPLSSSAYAAEKEKKKTRRVPALRESTYKKISEANVMIDPEAQMDLLAHLWFHWVALDERELWG